MIQKSRQGNNLKEYVKSVPYIDTNETSKNYFRVSKFPDRLYVGKNSFRISGNNENLVVGSRIYVDVVDDNGNIIYHEVLNVISKDKSRIVVIHVYSNTPVGEATVYIAGRLRRDPQTGNRIPYDEDPNSQNNKDVPNLIWVGKTSVVIDSSNPSELFYGSEPNISFSERLVAYYEISGSDRRTTISGSGQRLSIASDILPSQFSNLSKFDDAIVEEGKVFRSIPVISDNVGEYDGGTRIPEFAELTKIKANEAIFTKTMEGGRIFVNNISVTDSLPKGVTVTIPDYSASIVRVINNTTIEVDRPFSVQQDITLEDGTTRTFNFTKFINEPTYSISYFDDNINKTETLVSESFANIEFRGLEPLAGTLDKIAIRYKSVGSFGNFRDVGEFKIEEQNYLVDQSVQKLTLDQGLTEKRIGYVESQSEVNQYWTGSGVNISGTSLLFNEDNITNAFEINHSGSFSKNHYVVITKTGTVNTNVLATRGTEYTLKFESYYDADPAGTGSWNTPFMDVYISGSNIQSDQVNTNDLNPPLKDRSLGTYIGTVDSRYGKQNSNKIHFITTERKEIKPFFVIRSGKWTIGKIEINPRLEEGYSPNQYKLSVPISDLQQRSELVFDFNYLNKDSKPANISTKIFGVKFRGSDSFVSRSIADLSASIDDRITQIEVSGAAVSGVLWDDIGNKPTVISSSQQIAEDISGSLTEFSQSVLVELGQRPTGSAIDNQILFWDSGIAGSNDLIWDSSTNRFGVNTNTPNYDFHLVGDFYLTGHVYDKNESTGSNGQILTSTPSGLLWSSGSTSSSGSFSGSFQGDGSNLTGVTINYSGSDYEIFFRSSSTLDTDPIFLWQDDTLKVGDVHIKPQSIGFETKRLIIKNGSNEDLIITGSTKLRSVTGQDVLNIKNTLGNDSITVNDEGVFILQAFNTEPTPIEGGLMSSGSDLYFGV